VQKIACIFGFTGMIDTVPDAPVDAGVIVSAPLLLEPCSVKLERGFSRFYQYREKPRSSLTLHGSSSSGAETMTPASTGASDPC
jgi:hypothetical protein